MNQRASPARILAYDHIGIRVSDRRRAMAFYRSLGFVESASFQCASLTIWSRRHAVTPQLVS